MSIRGCLHETQSEISFRHDKKFCLHQFSLWAKWNGNNFYLDLLIYYLCCNEKFACADGSFRRISFGPSVYKTFMLRYFNTRIELQFGVFHVNGYKWLTIHRIENISLRPKWTHVNTVLASLLSIITALITSLTKLFDFHFSMSGCTKLVTPSPPLRRRVGHFENWMKVAARIVLLEKGGGNSRNRG